MKISERINWFIVKRVIIFFVLIFYGWNLFQIYERDKSFFPFGKIFSVELFLQKRMDPSAMMMSVFGSIAREAKKYWKEEKLEIQIVSELSRLNTSKKFPTDNPTICLIYKAEYIKKKVVYRYIDFEFNEKFSGIILDEKNKLPEVDGEKVIFDDFELISKMAPWQAMLREANRFSLEDYQEIKKEFPKLVYSFEELRAIRANGIAISAIHFLTHAGGGECRIEKFAKSSWNFKRSKDCLINQASIMYALFFYGKAKYLCWLEDAKHKGKIFLAIIMLMFLSLHFFRVGFLSILSQELFIHNIKINFQRKFWLCLVNWQEFIFTASQKKLEKIICDICNQYAPDKEDLRVDILAEKALLVSDELKKELGEDDFAKDCYLQTLLAITQDREKKVTAYRENCLGLLKASLDKLRKKEEIFPAEVLFVPLPVKKNKTSGQNRTKEKNKIKRREALFSQLKDLLPKTCALVFDSWRNSDLDDLCLTLVLLKGINNNLIHAFLSRPNFEMLIKNKQSKFMIAVKADRREEVASMLKEASASNLSIKKTKEVERKEYFFPNDLEIDVVFGERSWGKSVEIKTALLARGAKIVCCYEASRAQKLIAISKKTSGNRLIVTTFPPHGYGNIISNAKGRLPVIWSSDTVNVTVFANEIAFKFHKLNN
jgi:hypothetical protein